LCGLWLPLGITPCHGITPLMSIALWMGIAPWVGLTPKTSSSLMGVFVDWD
jgi:hypothetical protein